MTASLALVPTFKPQAEKPEPRYLGLCMAAAMRDKPSRPVALIRAPGLHGMMVTYACDLDELEIWNVCAKAEEENVILHALLDLREAIERGTDLGPAQEYPVRPVVRPHSLRLVSCKLDIEHRRL
jgi:hypothetical protein